jgi:hypothetical protein
MDKNIITTFVCIIIFYIVYIKISSQNIKQEKIEVEIEPEMEMENFGNNLENIKFDIYNYYNNLTSSTVPTKITKDNFDYDYETDFKYKNVPIIAQDNTEHYHPGVYYPKKDLNFDTQGGGNMFDEKRYSKVSNIRFQEESPNFTTTGKINFLVPNKLESNATYSVPFPENTSIELAQFNAENVTDLYNADNMENLYNNINADVYRGYRTMKYML